jgi:hypothetical protein
VIRNLLVALVLLLAGCGGGPADNGSPDLSKVTLRLEDLPEGFRYGDDRGCGGVGTTEGSDPGLDEFLIETRPQACVGEFNRLWGDQPGTVDTAMFSFGSEDDARNAWLRRKSLFGSFASIFLTTEHGSGDAVTFDSSGLNNPGAGEAWRDGRLVIAVYEEGLSGDEGRAFARDLAKKQRARIESPSEPVAVEEDDREIGLEDPSIAVPVYWLGREFEPEGLAKLELYRGDNLGGHEGPPGDQVKIDYSGERASVTLDLWKPATWKKFKKTRLGRMIWSSPCARTTDLEVDGGRAEIFGGYSGACRGEPDHWLAHVYYDDVVVAVNMSYCYMCGGRPPGDPYNSREGMEAVVRALKRR